MAQATLAKYPAGPPGDHSNPAGLDFEMNWHGLSSQDRRASGRLQVGDRHHQKAPTHIFLSNFTETYQLTQYPASPLEKP